MGNRRKSVPVVLQMETLECGAASLAMILAYYKKYISLEQLRLECGVTRDGSNAKNILRAARHNGLAAQGYRYSVEKLRDIPLPAILFWNFNHFVVLTGFKNNKAYINDPASGKVVYDIDTFQESYTGIVLVLKKGEQFKPDGKKKGVADFLPKRKGYLSAMIAMAIIGLVLSLTNAIVPVFSKLFTDFVLLGKASEWSDELLIGMGITMLFLFIQRVFLTHILAKTKNKMTTELSCAYLWHTLRLPIAFFAQRAPGDICNRQEDNGEITDILFGKLGFVVIDVLMVAIYFLALFYYSPLLAAMILIVTIFNGLLTRMIAWKNAANLRSSMRDEGKLVGAAMAGIAMMETIKASGAEAGFFEKMTGYQAIYNNSEQALKSRSLFMSLVPTFLTELCNVVVLIIGVGNILNGHFTIGMLLAFQGFLAMFFMPFHKLINSFDEVQKMFIKMERIDDVLQFKTDVEIDLNPAPQTETAANAGDIRYKKLMGKVELKNVSFGYSPLAAPLIEGFHLSVQPGEMVALVGASGSGKSTIANLITGLYQIRSGEILFDGKSRQEIDRYVFTGSVSVVDQSITIFKDTIRNNLTLWEEAVEEETLLAACKDACIYDDIMARPEGFLAEMSEGGYNFSGGQRQRLEIARAFISNPAILILDEATSALDPMTEEKIMHAVKRRRITCILIAHRLSTIRDADQIIVLEQGKEVERGTHNELMQNPNGYYAKLIKQE